MILVIAAIGALAVLLLWVGAARHYMDVKARQDYWKWASGTTLTYQMDSRAQTDDQRHES